RPTSPGAETHPALRGRRGDEPPTLLVEDADESDVLRLEGDVEASTLAAFHRCREFVPAGAGPERGHEFACGRTSREGSARQFERDRQGRRKPIRAHGAAVVVRPDQEGAAEP